MSISQDSPLAAAAAAADTERDALLQNGDSVSASLAAELESLLLQLSETNDGMGRCVSDCQTGEGARMSNVLQRHRELLHEYEKEFRKIKANIKEQRERDDLLHSVRQDIGEFRTAASSRTDSLVRERGATQHSLRTVDKILSGAATTYDALRSQRQFYNNVALKLSSFRSRLPTIDSLIGRIQRRKKMESIILAVVIAFCAIIVIYFSILR
ncbi:Golgi SNAP receptor complex member 1B [Guillardia theta CCMP2712]|uniref:Golgi SNAP receptor complex member 1B n=1 Tax=Guillardia theta (strain CCMP2712) TaxID=905079 RepID=L1INW4_GUITC|nr:Golgi SNAP receptor complex member 1B [Guillardia theta CCMP2712]EKX37981.1 Golgi SNAP receptor complex member 1B [Guillardia theta CCMP2712]|eukprot:XP_005824961.1 Golgi SNAP receptor complex member 1B [Guillardia theta CCMP2712]